MDVKKCFKCGVEFPLIYFYKHSEMKDGHLNKCKKCSRKDSLEHRQANLEKVRAYDKRRSQTPERKKHGTENTKRWRKENPEKYKAHCLVNNGLRDGKLKKENCCICGSVKSQAHHEDYADPLNVIWVCAQHHREIDLR